MRLIRISVAGAAGKMGRAVTCEALKTPGVEIAGLYEKSGHKLLGRKISGITVSGGIEAASESADVIVDFTSPAATLSHTRWCGKTGKSMVIGTTGFTAAQRDELIETARGFPCVIAPNMSVGVNFLESVISLASQKLHEDFDIEIAEIHHRHKTDSPSGTALALARTAAEEMGETLEDAAVFGKKRSRPRGKNEIGIQSVRGGDTPGEHTVYFFGSGERIEISHRAHSRKIFAAGALKAAKWVSEKPAGIYGMKEVLGL